MKYSFSMLYIAKLHIIKLHIAKLYGAKPFRHACALMLSVGLLFSLTACNKQPAEGGATGQNHSDSSVGAPADGSLPDKLATKVLKEKQASCSEDCYEARLEYVVFPERFAWLDELQWAILAGDNTSRTISENAINSSIDQNKEKVRKQLREFVVPESEDQMDAMPHSDETSIEFNKKSSRLAVLTMSQYLYLGGAHGMPALSHYVVDLSTREVLGFDDILVNQKAKDDLMLLAKEHHISWLNGHLDGLPESAVNKHLETWPFFLTDNWYLDEKGLHLQYGAYEIAPYAAGLPDFVIPTSRLDGVVKPAYLSGL